MVVLSVLLRKLMEEGNSYPEIKRELEQATREAVLALEQASKKVETEEDLLKVARTSMDDEAAAKIVSEVVWKTGTKGAVTITDHTGRDVIYEKVEGYSFGRGFLARGMINDKDKQQHIAPNKNFPGPVGIAVVEGLIATEEHILPILQAAESRGLKNVAIFCPNLIGEALGIVALNQMRGSFNIVAIQHPGQGEKTKDHVNDLCAVTGAGVPVGVFNDSNFGIADSIKVTVDNTTVVGGHGDTGAIQNLIAHLQGKADEQKEEYDKEYYHQRQARLQGGIVVVKVGATTETELRLRLKKVEDAINACKCALEEGICPGAGMTLKGIKTSSNALNGALGAIVGVVCQNAEIVVPDVKPGETVNVLTGEVGDFLSVGVVDATKVLRTVVQTATSIAKILCSTSGIITSMREYDSKEHKTN